MISTSTHVTLMMTKESEEEEKEEGERDERVCREAWLNDASQMMKNELMIALDVLFVF